MANVMKQFEDIKQGFQGVRGGPDKFITLPHPLHDHTDTANGIEDGEIRITE
jgi:hypothetical protein